MTTKLRSYPKNAFSLNKTSLTPKDSFRSRGFSFLKEAGTNRRKLNFRYMWRTYQDCKRLLFSTFVKYCPTLAPSPLPTQNRYYYAPPVKNPDDFSFILVGDTGMNSPGQYLVTSAIALASQYPSAFCLVLGDVMYPAGGEESYQYGLLEAFQYYPHPVLAIPGNHDWYDNLKAYQKFFIRDDTNLSPTFRKRYPWKSPKIPNWYYYMDFGNSLRIICLDTGITGELKQHRKSQLNWLDHLLETAENRKVLLMMHHPPYALRPRGHEKKLRAILEPRLKKANIVAVFSGHDHNYQRHTIAGCQFVVQGAGGASLHKLPALRQIALRNGETVNLTAKNGCDHLYSFTHCRWHENQLTCTTLSAHEVPGGVLDRFVL